jgi:hypothetical protein
VFTARYELYLCVLCGSQNKQRSFPYTWQSHVTTDGLSVRLSFLVLQSAGTTHFLLLLLLLLLLLQAHVMAQAVSRQPLNVKASVQSLVIPCEICGGQSGTVTGLSPNTSAFPCQYNSTYAPYSFIHLPPTLYNVSLPVLQFSPVSIIPPMLHTHSFICHRCCIILPIDSVVREQT